MSHPYCQVEDLNRYLYSKYLAKIEEFVPGIAASHIEDITREIDDALRPRFRLPLTVVPETITRICRVMAAYRCAGSLTSLMATEAMSDNEWIPLQTQYKEVIKQLADVASGKLDVGLEALGNEIDDGYGGLAVTGGQTRFGDKFWRRF